MNLIVADNYEEMSRVAADVLADVIEYNPSCVLGLATGSTPIGIYRNLVKDYETGRLSFKDVKTFNLDEYVGLDERDSQSYRYFMNDNLFDHVNINKANTHVPSGLPSDVEDECSNYDTEIEEAGGIDIQLLGIGHNGHIGFNEPCKYFPKNTHKVKLTESTIEANSRLFDSIEDVPRYAVTMGIGTIMTARRILLVANGADKADIVYKAFFCDVEPEVPASILQFHPNVTVVTDKEAARKCL